MKKNRARKKWPACPGSVALGRELRPLPGCPALRAHAWSRATLASGSLWPAGPAPPGGFGPFPCNPTHDLDPSLAKTLGGRVFAGCGVPRPARPGVTASPAHPLPFRPCEQSAALVRPPLSAVSVVPGLGCPVSFPGSLPLILIRSSPHLPKRTLLSSKLREPPVPPPRPARRLSPPGACLNPRRPLGLPCCSFLCLP